MAIKTHRSSKAAEGSRDGGTRDLSWEDVGDKFDQRVGIVDISGDTGTGRTRLALTAPGPIALIHDSEKIQGLVQRVKTGDRKMGIAPKEIRAFDFGLVLRGGKEERARKAMEMWRRLQDHWYDALGNWARTIVFDTDTAGWELIRFAFFGGKAPEGGRIDANWGPVNAAWLSLFRAARMQTKTNVILIGQTKDEYSTSPGPDAKKKGGLKKGGGNTMGQRTGRTIRAGQKQVPIIADVGIRTERETTREGSTFTATVIKGWMNAAWAEGTEFEGEESNFANIMSFVTETDVEEWQ